jgi:hypothetical protein
MTVIDSTIWIDLLNDAATRQVRWLRERLSSDSIALTDLVLCEVLRGLPAAEARYRHVRELFEELLIFDTGGTALAFGAADNYRFLRSKGQTVRGTIDCITATYCIREGHDLLHNDRDFDPFEKHLGLKVIHP